MIAPKRLLCSLVFVIPVIMTKVRVYAQQANYRASVTQTMNQCRFGQLLSSKGNWHDENPADQLILEQIGSISEQLKATGGIICDDNEYDLADDNLKSLMSANARKQVACAMKSIQAFQGYKLSAALYFSKKELESEQRILHILMYAKARRAATGIAVSAVKAFNENESEITDLKDYPKDTKKATRIIMLLMQNKKSEAAADAIKFAEDKAGDKVKDVIKDFDKYMSAAYLNGLLIDWQYKNGIAAMQDHSVMECS